MFARIFRTFLSGDNRLTKPAVGAELRLRPSPDIDSLTNNSLNLSIRNSHAASPEETSSLMVSSAGAKVCQVRQTR